MPGSTCAWTDPAVLAVVQRVSRASVTTEAGVSGAIEGGLLVLLGVAHGDDEEDAQWLAAKCASLRIFPDQDGKMNVGLIESGGSMLVVSQFTLLGDCEKGRRPSFVGAAPPEMANHLYERFVAAARAQGIAVATGVFQAHMDVALVNDGPVTLIVDSGPWKRRRSGGVRGEES